MVTERKQYTAECKREAVRLNIEGVGQNSRGPLPRTCRGDAMYAQSNVLIDTPPGQRQGILGSTHPRANA